MFRTNWRGSAEWRDEGLPIRSSSSDEAIKLYDSALTQLVGWFDHPIMGGLPKTLDDMTRADPEFVLGNCLKIGLELLGTGTTIRLNKSLNNDLQQLLQLTHKRKNGIEEREYKHVEALNKFGHGDWTGAANIWEEILVDHPTDIHALKFCHDTFFYLGRQSQIKDSIARVLPIWKESSLPLKSYIHGMYAFGLEESKFYERAEREATLALELNKNDGWATHAISHVMIMEGRLDQGIDFMSSTVKDWEICNYLSCHNFWHLALFHIERQEYESAINLFESEIGRRALSSGMMLDIVDATSFLYRMDLIQPKQFVTAKHWEDVYKIVEPHLNDHILGFNDAHFLMACLGAQHKEEAQQLIETFDNSLSSDSWTEVTIPLLEAMIAFNEEKYEQTVEKLNEIRYNLLSIGGSDAQRDVFNQLLIVAALKSPKEHHKRLCHRLIAERQALNSSPFANTLLSVK